MYDLFMFTGLFAFIMLIIGLIKPKWGTFGKAPNMKRWKIFLIWFLIFIISANLYDKFLPPEIKEAQRIEQEKRQAEKEKEAKEKAFAENIFVKVLGLTTQEELADVERAFKDVGIDEIENIAYDENLGDISNIRGYRLKVNGLNNVFLYMTPDNKVDAIRYNNINLYKDGQFIETIFNNTVTAEEEAKMKLTTEKIILKLLKAPSTAKFPSHSDYQFSKRHGIGKITGFVDAQNSFGAMIRSTFNATFDFKNGGKITHLYFDGNQIF